ncbi:hypothetical protein DNTS_004325, partial [Danionella cerebrum]
VIFILLPMSGSVPLARWIQSPGHPLGYGPYLNITWNECATAGYKITLTLIHVDLEKSFRCINDALKPLADVEKPSVLRTLAVFSRRRMMIVFYVIFILLPMSGSVPLARWIMSPGHPLGYGPYLNITWNDCATAGYKITLTLIHVDLEKSFRCINDALKVSEDEQLFNVSLCGRISMKELESSINPLLHSSPGGCLSVSFLSDYSNPARYTGFRGFYTTQDVDECTELDSKCAHLCNNYIGGYRCFCAPGYILAPDKHTCLVSCGEDLSSSEGVLMSPLWPKPYPENLYCSYKLAVEEGKQFELTFTEEFDVEEAENGQCNDSLTIKPLIGEAKMYCGRKLPSPFLTRSHSVKIYFKTNDKGVNRGYSLSYRTIENMCIPHMVATSILAPQHDEYSVDDKVIVTCGKGHIMTSLWIVEIQISMNCWSFQNMILQQHI